MSTSPKNPPVPGLLPLNDLPGVKEAAQAQRAKLAALRAARPAK